MDDTSGGALFRMFVLCADGIYNRQDVQQVSYIHSRRKITPRESRKYVSIANYGSKSIPGEKDGTRTWHIPNEGGQHNNYQYSME